MRLQLLIWLQANRELEIAPGVSIAHWTSMEGYENFNAYVAHVHTSGVWIDTPMLFAASAVYGVQIVCFVGKGEPEAIIAPSVADLPEVPVCTIANINNVHFVALRPDQCEAPVAGPSDSKGDLLLLPSAADEAEEDGATPPSEDQWVRGHTVDDDTSASMLVLGGLIFAWKPFSTDGMQSDIKDALRGLDLEQTVDATSSVFQTLQRRDAIKLWQREQKEKQEGVDREHVYQLAARFHASRGIRGGRSKQFAKSRRLCTKLNMRCIVEALGKKCAKHGAAHTCLDVFRALPLCVLRWRRLWYSLPKADREQRLVDMYGEQKGNGIAIVEGSVGFSDCTAQVGPRWATVIDSSCARTHRKRQALATPWPNKGGLG